MKRARNTDEVKMEAIVPRRFEDLPADLVQKIFINFPVKGLINLSLVSNVWASIIHNRSFVRLWFYHHVSSLPATVIFTPTLIPDFMTKCSSDSLLKVNEPTDFDVIVPLFQNPNSAVWFNGACHGLLCVSLGTDSIVLWNPLTSKFNTVLNPVELSRPDISFLAHGFGFDPSRNDYVILSFPHVYIDRLFGHNIYNTQLHFFSLNTRIWNVNPGDDHLDYYPMDSNFQYAHDSIIWYSKHPEEEEVEEEIHAAYFIVSFSLTTHIITQFRMPEPAPLSDGNDGLSLGILDNPRSCVHCARNE